MSNYILKNTNCALSSEEHRLDTATLNSLQNCAEFVKKGAVYGRFFKSDDCRNNEENLKEGNNSTQLYGTVIYETARSRTRESDPLVVKQTSSIWHREFSSSFAFINEMNFFTKFVPAFSKLDGDASFASLFPKFYHGEMVFCVGRDHGVIIFEDLGASGYKMSDKRSFIDYDHLAVMMRKLGQFHAYSYKAKKDAPQLFHTLIHSSIEANPMVNKNGFEYEGLAGACKRGLDDLARDSRYSQYVPKIEQMLENAYEIFVRTLTADRDGALSVIAHGDYLRSNVMFRYESDTPVDGVIIDMATYRCGSPVIDLAIVLYLHADRETKDKYWDSLLDEYYAALKKTFAGDGVPAKSEILSQFVGRSFYAYLIASIFLPFIIACDDDTLPDFTAFKTEKVDVEAFIERCLTMGGERATKALSDILKDMIDRGFICD